MRTVSSFCGNANRFAGTLPNRAVAGFGALFALFVSDNDFEGKNSPQDVRNPTWKVFCND
eukprot:1006489-Amphidinium_carterae.1